MKKIIVTGNREIGLASELNKHIDADFISRSNGYDLLNDMDFSKFIEKTLEYDVFINNSRLKNFQQTNLLVEVANTWLKNKKQGKIINIGSVADRIVSSLRYIDYASRKASLKKANSILHYRYCFEKSGISSTYIAFGYLDTPSCQSYKIKNIIKMPLEDAAKTIVWVLNQPKYYSIEEIRLDSVQIR